MALIVNPLSSKKAMYFEHSCPYYEAQIYILNLFWLSVTKIEEKKKEERPIFMIFLVAWLSLTKLLP